MFLLLSLALNANAALEQIGLLEYRCIVSNQETEYEANYYFTSIRRPTPVPDSQVRSFFCNSQGRFIDHHTISRREEKEVLKLFSPIDSGFLDIDQNGAFDVNDRLSELLNLKISLFGEINDSIGPFDEADGPIGYYHLPFSTPYTSYCLEEWSTSPDDLAVKNELGVNTTMGLYVGLRFAEYDQRGKPVCKSADKVYITEADISQVWFYIKNNQQIRPTSSEEIRSNEMYFYYPPNREHPFAKGRHQDLYIVTNAQKINGCPTGIPKLTGYPTADRRIGCVPKD